MRNSIDHYKNICKNATLQSNSLKSHYEMVMKMKEKRYVVKWSNAILKYQLQHEDYLMKTHHTIYPYDLNGWTKFMNKDISRGKLSPPLPTSQMLTSSVIYWHH